MLPGMKRRYALISMLALTLLGACNAEKTETTEKSGEAETAAVEGTKVRMKTNKGDIVIELNAGKAPITVKNFLKYVGDKHYDGTVFHRVIDGFMIQGGGFALDGGNLVEKKTGEGIKNESQNGLKNDKGTIAMARTNNPDSATAQFFINVADNHFLDKAQAQDGWGYAVFAKVVDGMDVLNKIKAVPTGTSGFHRDVPKDTVLIESAEIVEG